MSQLLKIDVSTRGAQSLSRSIGTAFVDNWKKAHAGGTVVERDLSRTLPSFVDLQWIAGAFSAPDQHTDEHRAALKLSDELIAELKAADQILISTPMYNFAAPAALKAWIDNVVRVGLTFNVKADGSYAGLLSGKKATVVIASSGALAGTPYDHLTPYLQLVLGFIGISDVQFVQGGGTSAVSYGKISEAEFLAPFQREAATLAAA